MLINSRNQSLLSAGQNAVAYYKANASVTVVTKDNNYIVTISDWSALQAIYNTYIQNPNAFDNSVIANSNNTNYESSILSAFSGAINLYSNSGSASYYPLTINSSNQVSEIPCPN